MSDRPYLSRSILSVAPLVFLGIAACGGGDEPSALGGVASERLMPITTAMSWRGELPCADCPGIRTTVTLLPDGSYRRDDAYLGTGEAGDTIFGEVGRYILDRSGEILTLHGSGEGPGYFTALAGGNLRMRNQSGEEFDSDLDYTLVHLPNPVRQEGLVRISGLLTYYADSALLLECQGGVQLPVAMLGEYRALEAAYLERGLGGAPLAVRLSGRVEDRPAMEGAGNEPVVLVESFEVLDSLAACPALDLREQLAGKEWQLEWVWGDVEGEEVTGGVVPTLRWNPEEVQLSGNSGCNQYSGRGVLRGSLLVSGEVGSTRMFCEGVMEREARILSLFANDLVVRIDGEVLALHRRGEVAAVYRNAGG